MSTLTGNVKDFRPQAIGGATLIFTATNPAAGTSGGALFLTREIRVTAASNGDFTVELASYEFTNPKTAYRMQIEWISTGGGFIETEDIPWLIVVTGNGYLTDMFANVEPSRFLVKGEKGDPGDSVMQAALDALELRVPQRNPDSRFEVVDLNSNIMLGTTDDGGVILEDALVSASEGFTVETEDGYVLFDAEDLTSGNGGVNPSVKIDTLHLFLCVGQSNMSGRGMPISGEVPDARIFQFGANRRVFEPATVPLDMFDQSTAAGLSPATPFAKNYLRTQPANVGVLLIPAAQGGTGFTDSPRELTWTPNKATNPALDLPAQALSQARAGIYFAKAEGYAVKVTGILWHQGENNPNHSQAKYEELQDSLTAYLRDGLGDAKLPFVVGQMSIVYMEESSLPRLQTDRAHSGTPARVPYTGFAPSLRGATNEGDTTHFSKVGVEYLGKTYLAGYWQAIGNNQAAPPQPPSNVTATKTGTTVTVQFSGAPGSLVKGETFDLINSSSKYEWTAPASHVTGFRVETKTGTSAWTTATRLWGMALTEKVTVPTGTTQVRVTALNGATESAPVTVTAIGA